VDSMKSALMHAVAHDLRAPLASMLAGASALNGLEELPPDLQRRLLEGLILEGRKMDRLLADLMDLDRLERGILEPKRRPTDVGELVRRVAGEVSELNGRPLTIQAGSVMAEVEESKVERIVENLLRNLVVHTPEGTRAWVTVDAKEAGVLIVVEDAGPGVPDEIKDSIFKPFNQGPEGAENIEGYGIGLSLVARFAELHGGRAWVEDRMGGGASFRVHLPG
jgi:two-component system, OmpR family, sensor histidine kinase KdpD